MTDVARAVSTFIPGELRIIVPGPPRSKGRPRLAANGGTYTPKTTRSYELHVRTCALAASMRCSWRRSAEHRYAVTVALYMPNERRVDLDNLAKSQLDALNWLIFVDDSQIDELHVYKRIDREKPRAEVTVRILLADRETVR